MLDLGRYLVGVAEILLLVGFALLGATAARRRLVPDLEGPAVHLATAVPALALLLWVAELLGTFGAFEPLPYLLLVAAAGVALWTLLRGWRQAEGGRERTQFGPPAGPPPTGVGTRGRGVRVATLVALAVAGVAVLHFADGVLMRLDTGMTGFDSTWYHGPFAAGFHQMGNTWDLHFIAPQFLAWFYPANSEIFHAVGIGAFDRDLLSPLLNLGWFLGCLLACWCIGRPYRVAPWSLALGAIALSVPTLSDQAGEARNDIVGIFFLLAAVAIALNALPVAGGRADAATGHESGEGGSASPLTGTVLLVALAAGLAAGTKLNYAIPAVVLVAGTAAVGAPGTRLRALGLGTLAALAGGGYWYLRNLAHTGNPLPWFGGSGPVSLPSPDQALGGREAHSVLGYLTDGSVWSEWFLPGLHHGLWLVWPALLGAAVAGIALSFARRSGPVVRIVGLTAAAAALAWLVAPTSASGPEGMPRGFESGLRYLAPALVLGLVLLPIVPAIRDRLPTPASRSYLFSHSGKNYDLERGGGAGFGWRSRSRSSRSPPAISSSAIICGTAMRTRRSPRRG